MYTKLVVKFIMALGSPESAGIPRLAHIAFTGKVILNRTASKSLSSIYYELELVLYRVVHTLHTFFMAIPWTLTPSEIQ